MAAQQHHETGGLPNRGTSQKVAESYFSFRLPHVLILQPMSFSVATITAQTLCADKDS